MKNKLLCRHCERLRINLLSNKLVIPANSGIQVSWHTI